MGQRSPVWNEKKGRPTPARSRHRLAAVEAKAQALQGSRVTDCSDQWAGKTGPGVAPSGGLRTSQQLKTPSHSGTCLRADLHPTCANSTFANSVHGRVVPTKGQGPAPVETAPGRLQTGRDQTTLGSQNTYTHGRRHGHRPEGASLVPSL